MAATAISRRSDPCSVTVSYGVNLGIQSPECGKG